MFIAKVAYMVIADLPDIDNYNKYTDGSDGAYYEIEVADGLDNIVALGVISEAEASKLVEEDVSYLMIWVPFGGLHE